MNLFPFPALMTLGWLFLPVLIIFLIRVFDMKYPDTQRCIQFNLSENETTGETPAGPDTSRP